MQEKLNQLLVTAQKQLDAVKEDAVKFANKGNKAAGTRTRTGSMDLIKTLKEVRTVVTEIKNA